MSDVIHYNSKKKAAMEEEVRKTVTKALDSMGDNVTFNSCINVGATLILYALQAGVKMNWLSRRVVLLKILLQISSMLNRKGE